jgi:protein-L-isoaspartate O-methyltransferase
MAHRDYLFASDVSLSAHARVTSTPADQNIVTVITGETVVAAAPSYDIVAVSPIEAIPPEPSCKLVVIVRTGGVVVAPIATEPIRPPSVTVHLVVATQSGEHVIARCAEKYIGVFISRRRGFTKTLHGGVREATRRWRKEKSEHECARNAYDSSCRSSRA